jgi:inner membrane transporter RhtA
MMDAVGFPIKPMAGERQRKAERIPPEAFFICSAIFHYLGPAFAVLLFARVDVLGVAWLRIASAAVVFAVWKRPWRLFVQLDTGERRTVIALGFVLAIMNVCFYLACSGVFLLTSMRISGEPIGYIFAFANCALFVLYILLGHRIAATGGRGGVERLALAMLIASVVVTPVGLKNALVAVFNPMLLLAGAGVGICSSVIPYICDQFAMARLSKATFALMLSLLPATACLVGIVVLRQVPSISELSGVGAVIAGVALKRSADD